VSNNTKRGRNNKRKKKIGELWLKKKRDKLGKIPRLKRR